METYNKDDFNKAGISNVFVQDNQSSSCKGVLRGLHFQKHYPQAKLVRVLKGEVFDVAVDLRETSITYGKWVGIILSEENKKQLLIPRGFAHGFLVLSDYVEFAYKCDEFYHQEDEGGLIYNDPEIAVDWPVIDKKFLAIKMLSIQLLLNPRLFLLERNYDNNCYRWSWVYWIEFHLLPIESISEL